MRRLVTGIATLLALLAAGRGLAVNPGDPADMEIWVQVTPSVTLDAAISVSSTRVSVGQTFQVRLTVTNTGGGPATNVTATAWLSAGTGAAYTYSNPDAVASLAAGAGITFTWTATAMSVGAVQFTGTSSTDSGVWSNKPVSPNVQIQTPANLVTTVRTLSSSVCTGSNFIVTATVTNTGQAAALGVMVSDPLGTPAGSAVLVDGPNPAVPVDLPLNGAVTFSWTYTGTVPGLSNLLTVTATGADANSGYSVSSGPVDSKGYFINDPGMLDISGTIPPTLSTGQTFWVAMTVTNTGGGSVAGVIPHLALFQGGGVVTPVSGPLPAGPVTLDGGEAQTFSWSYNAAAAGFAAFSLTATGTTCGAPIVGAVEVSTTVQSGAALAMRIDAYPTPRNVGQNFLVTITVTNTGDAAAENVTAGAFTLVGAGSAAYQAGPNPPLPLALLAGKSMITFTWTYQGSIPGTVAFRNTVSGADANSKAAVSAGPFTSAAVTIQTPANLAAGMAPSTASSCIGQDFMVFLTVNNTGGAGANAVTPDPVLLGGTGAAIPSAGPNPASAFIPGGGWQVFTWTYTGSAAGTVTFMTTVTGSDVNTAATVIRISGISAPVTVDTPGALAAYIKLPASVSVGQNFSVELTVSNTGGTAVTTVTPSITLTGTAPSVPVSGPTPGGFGVITPAQSNVFTWVYRATAGGNIGFTATGQGTTCGIPMPVVADDTGTVTVVAAASLTGSVTVVPAAQVRNYDFLVTMTVSNAAGSASATVFVDMAGTAGIVGGKTGPTPPGGAAIPGGSSLAFSWTYTGIAAGVATFIGTVTGYDINSNLPLTVVPAPRASATVLEPASLAGTLQMIPAATGVGNDILVVFTVRNTGDAPATLDSMNSGYWDNKGGAVFTLVDGPAPTIPPVIVLGGGKAVVFTWTVNGSVCGYGTSYADSSGFENATSNLISTGQVISNRANVFGMTSSVIVDASRTQEKVGGLVGLRVKVLDNCLPTPVGVSLANVSIVILAGGGGAEPASGRTDSNGEMQTTLRLGKQPGINAIRADVAGTPGGTVFVQGTVSDQPTHYLTKNFFNPRNDTLKVRVTVPESCRLSVRVFNMAGELVRKLKDEDIKPGLDETIWDGKNDSAEIVANGVYFVQVLTGKDSQIRKVIVLKQ